MVFRCALAVAMAIAGSVPTATAAAPAARVALFPFELVNTSLESTRPDEEARLAVVTGLARQRFAAAGFEVVDTAPVAPEVAAVSSLRGCNGCELPLARQLGADFAAVGWVQKVSNLILNVNLQIRDVATGRLVQSGSVDIRGNTDESWRRGTVYLLERRILPPELADPSR
jgi:Protein of unknown function (DUF2380)